MGCSKTKPPAPSPDRGASPRPKPASTVWANRDIQACEAVLEPFEDAAFGSKVLASSRGVSEVFARPFEDLTTGSVLLEDPSASSKTVTEPNPPSAAFKGCALDAIINSLEEFLNRPEPVPALGGIKDLLNQSPAPHPESKSKILIKNPVLSQARRSRPLTQLFAFGHHPNPRAS